jgi:hypothetical protein
MTVPEPAGTTCQRCKASCLTPGKARAGVRHVLPGVPAGRRITERAVGHGEALRIALGAFFVPLLGMLTGPSRGRVGGAFRVSRKGHPLPSALRHCPVSSPRIHAENQATHYLYHVWLTVGGSVPYDHFNTRCPVR